MSIAKTLVERLREAAGDPMKVDNFEVLAWLCSEAADEIERIAPDAERLNWLERQHLEELSMQLVVDAKHDGEYYVCGDSNRPGYGPTLRSAIDAAMLAG